MREAKRKSCVPVNSVEDLIVRIRTDVSTWPERHLPWFRGEPDMDTKLLPKLYRKSPHPNENQLLQTFRMMAPSYASEPSPPREAIDQWLCLAQHVGLPTRLLDWTENALIAVHFALREEMPVVWMLDPIGLNNLSVSKTKCQLIGTDEFPLPWHRPEPPNINIGNENIRGAWEKDQTGIDLPVAILPPYVHSRIVAQRSRFTVQGKRKDSLCDLIPPKLIKRYQINPEKKREFKRDLQMLGIEEATAFPDLDGIARELTDRYG